MSLKMVDVLHNILKIGLFISLAYVFGLAARAWLEVRIFALLVLGSGVVGLFLNSVILQQELKVGQDIQNLLTAIAAFTPLGFVTGPPILRYFGARLERFLDSDLFDPIYRQFAKRHKTAFARDNKDAFYDFFRAHQAGTSAGAGPGSGTFRDRARAGSGASAGSSYEQYSQYRRSQTKTENAPPPPPQDYRSDKDKMLDILEVSNRNADAKALKSAYRKLAWKYHPDVLAKTDMSDAQVKAAGARMQEINHAYDWLKDNGFAE